jgi:CxxC motif-containing protein (DUF1111 family)
MIRSLPAVTAAAMLAATVAAGPDTPQPKMGAPLPGLTADQLESFFVGQTAFSRELLEDEGLGPVFNKESCGNCHSAGAVVGGPGSQAVERAGLATKGGFDPLEDYGGSLFQIAAINLDCEEIIPDIANVFTLRITNGIMGYGLVEAIPDQSIIDVMNAQPVDVRGVAHMVGAFEDEETHVGRFGWKAQVPTVLTFTADAGLNELGLTTVFLQEDNDPNGIFDPPLEDCDSVDDPEDGIHLGNGVDKTFLDVVTEYQRFLAFPPQTPRSGMIGETIFNDIGCGVCHHAQFTTADDPELEDAIRNKTLRPYTDFLLHGMGTNGDGIVQGAGDESMLKTPPLAGLRARPALWHDGEFNGEGATEFEQFDDRVRGAIEAHDDEAHFSQGRFAKEDFDDLSPEDQAAVIRFLGSLGLTEFDHDASFVIDTRDFADFGHPFDLASCYGGGPYTPDDDCAVHDLDQDGLVDDDDFEAFLTVYEDPLFDCDGDGISDFREILDGTALDTDDDGTPDACEACPSDVDGNGEVNVDDLMLVLTWGPCGESPELCQGDTDRDGDRDVRDLIEVIVTWGPCQ